MGVLCSVLILLQCRVQSLNGPLFCQNILHIQMVYRWYSMMLAIDFSSFLNSIIHSVGAIYGQGKARDMLAATRVDMMAEACTVDGVLLFNHFCQSCMCPGALLCSPYCVKVSAVKLPMESLKQHEFWCKLILLSMNRSNCMANLGCMICTNISAKCPLLKLPKSRMAMLALGKKLKRASQVSSITLEFDYNL